MTHTSAGGKMAFNACASAICTYLKFDNFNSSLMSQMVFSYLSKDYESLEEVTSTP